MSVKHQIDRVEQLKRNGNGNRMPKSQKGNSQLNRNDLEPIDSKRSGRVLFLRNKTKNE